MRIVRRSGKKNVCITLHDTAISDFNKNKNIPLPDPPEEEAMDNGNPFTYISKHLKYDIELNI